MGGPAPGFDFSQAFSEGSRVPSRGTDLVYELPVSLEEVFHGASKMVSYRRGAQVERVSVKVPPGVSTGKKLRLAGKGEPGPQGAPAGDLFIKVRVLDHALYTRDGDDVEVSQVVSFTQAVLGATVEVPTLEGKTLSVRVPKGTQSGARLRLKGQGLPQFHGQGRGDLYVKLTVSVPSKLSKRQRELLEELAQEGL
jgi:curved DNA-binding protein